MHVCISTVIHQALCIPVHLQLSIKHYTSPYIYIYPSGIIHSCTHTVIHQVICIPVHLQLSIRHYMSLYTYCYPSGYIRPSTPTVINQALCAPVYVLFCIYILGEGEDDQYFIFMWFYWLSRNRKLCNVQTWINCLTNITIATTDNDLNAFKTTTHVFTCWKTRSGENLRKTARPLTKLKVSHGHVKD